LGITDAGKNGQGVAAVNGLGGQQPLGGGVDFQLDAVQSGRRPQPEGQPRGEVAPGVVLAQDKYLRLDLAHGLFQSGGVGVRLVVLEEGVVDDVDLVGAGGDSLGRQAADTAPRQQGRQGLP
jgi:hypothetical protein